MYWDECPLAKSQDLYNPLLGQLRKQKPRRRHGDDVGKALTSEQKWGETALRQRAVDPISSAPASGRSVHTTYLISGREKRPPTPFYRGESRVGSEKHASARNLSSPGSYLADDIY